MGGGREVLAGQLRKRRLRRHAPRDGNRVFHFRLAIKPAGWTLVGASLPLESSLKNTLPHPVPRTPASDLQSGPGSRMGPPREAILGEAGSQAFFLGQAGASFALRLGCESRIIQSLFLNFNIDFVFEGAFRCIAKLSRKSSSRIPLVPLEVQAPPLSTPPPEKYVSRSR